MGGFSELKRLAEAAGNVDWKWWDSNSFLRLTTERKGRHGADGDAISAYRNSIQCPESYRTFIEKASPAAVGELIAENEALRKDADRYRWLRSQHWNESGMAVVCQPKKSVRPGFDCPSGLRLDESIDAAMSGEVAHG